MASNETLNVSLGPTDTTGKVRREKWQRYAHAEGVPLGSWIRSLCDHEVSGSGRKSNPKWAKAAKDNGYENGAAMVREIVDWVLDKAVFKRGKGIVGFKK